MNNYWSGIFGQPKLKFFFETLIANKSFPQAIIIEGTKGCGKDAISARFAQLLNLAHQNKLTETIEQSRYPFSAPWIKYVLPLPTGANDSGHEDPLQGLPESTVQDILEQIKEKNNNPYHKMEIEAAKVIKLSSIRDVRRHLSLSSAPNLRRTVLISEADKMNEESQNSLLKDIEEPPENTTFILTTDNIEFLRETIISRCWVLKATPLDDADIIQLLTQSFDISLEDATNVAPLAEGSIFEAQNLCNENISKLKETTVSFLRLASMNRVHEAFQNIEKSIIKEGTQTIALFLRLIILWLGDAHKNRYGAENLYFNQHNAEFTKYNQRFSGVDLSEISRKIDKYLQSLYRNNANPSIIIHNLFYLIPDILKVKS